MEGNKNDTKNRVSIDYLKSIIETKDIPLSRRKLLVELIERKIDFRTLEKMKTHMFDNFPAQDIS